MLTLPLSTLIFLSLSAIGTSIISAVCGMGGGIVLLSLMTFFMPLKLIVPIHGIVQLISNTSRCWYLRSSIRLDIFISFALGLPFGVITSVQLIRKVDSPNIALSFIVILILYALFKPKRLPPIKIPIWGFAIVGFVSGFLGILIGATGPFIAPFFLRSDLEKKTIIATKSSVQVLVHLLKVPAFLYLGFNYLEHGLTITTLTMAAVFGTSIGVRLLGRIDDKIFRILYKSALLIAVFRIVINLFNHSITN